MIRNRNNYVLPDGMTVDMVSVTFGVWVHISTGAKIYYTWQQHKPLTT